MFKQSLIFSPYTNIPISKLKTIKNISCKSLLSYKINHAHYSTKINK